MSKSSTPQMELAGSLWVQKAGQKVFAEERIALLEKIHELGSITHAAKAVGISYKTAWDVVNLMNNLADRPLVERNAGGKGEGARPSRRPGWRSSGSSMSLRRSTGASCRTSVSASRGVGTSMPSCAGCP